MSDRASYQKLPPGWDCKIDQATGNCYYINYITRMMQLEDPRYKQLQNEQCSTESIPLQPLQSSPYHVHPRNNLQAIQAFQSGSMSSNHLCGSPLLQRSYLEKNVQTASKLSVVQTPRLGHGNRRQTIQETSFSSNKINTDLIVNKIQNMFPTAGENHIRLLLKKYYNREAVVISALQVEKHPVTMPGPFVTPPAQRHVFHASNEQNIANLHYFPAPRQLEGARIMSNMMDARVHHRVATPPASPYIGDEPWRHSPVPSSSSPKMKLRYMKNIFPKAEETFLLDLLASSDNNVQKVSERLISMGYVKRNFVPNSRNNKPHAELEAKNKENLAESKPILPAELSAEAKKEMQTRLQEKHSFVAEHLILMALESVKYDEKKAEKILQIVISDTDEQQANELEKQKQLEQIQQKQNKSNDNLTASSQNEQTNNVNLVDSTTNACINESDAETRLKTLPRKALLFAKFRNASNQLSSSKSSTSSTSSSSCKSPSATTTTTFKSNSCTIASTCVLSPTTTTIPTTDDNQLKSISQQFSKILSINNDANKTSKMGSSSTFTMNSSTASKHSLSHSSTTTQALDDATKASMRQLTQARSLDMPKQAEFQTLLERIVTLGHNQELANGPNEAILLADYVTWNGANAHNARGHQSDLVVGADLSIRTERNYTPLGHNAALCKGAQANLAKGSIYSSKYATKTSAANIKCN